MSMSSTFASAGVQMCSVELLQEFGTSTLVEKCQEWSELQSATYNCSLPGLESLTPGSYEGVTANYLSFATEISSPHFPDRAKEFEACTGGKIVFSEAQNIFEDPVYDLGTRTSPGSEVYDAYLMIYSSLSEASSLGLAETLNDRIREDNQRLRYEDILPKVRSMGEFRKNGKTNIDMLMVDGDFFVPIIRLDLLERFNMSLPNTWEEVVEYAKFFNGTDLNEDGDPNDFGFCHFPRIDSAYDGWWAEAFYSTWATTDQTRGSNQGFFFDQDTMEPRIGEGFSRAASIWKDLWLHGSDGCTSSNFVDGRCAIGFAPPGCWKGIFVNSDGVARKDANGTIVWRPTMKSGEYAEPYRFKPFGSTHIVDRDTGSLVQCTPELCPKADKIPARGHHGDDDRARVLPESPLTGQFINRAPFYWSGGYGTAIRQSADKLKKDLMWDFFVYVNSPDTSVDDVVQPSWLDSWRYSQLKPGNNFLQAGWSQSSYDEHQSVMTWALSNEVNGAYNIRLPGVFKYTVTIVGKIMRNFIASTLPLEEVMEEVRAGWEEVTAQEGKLDQLAIYRSTLGLEEQSDYELCTLHRKLMDKRDPSTCERFDSSDENYLLPAILAPTLVFLAALVVVYSLEKKRRSADTVWKISKHELKFQDPPQILGRGTFGLVVLAEYRGTNVAVKRVIPPNANSQAKYAGSASLGSMTMMPDVGLGTTIRTDESIPAQMLNSQRSAEVDESGTRLSTLTGSFFSKKKRKTRASRMPSVFLSSGNSNDHRQMKKDFISEMRLLSKLRHPSITTIMGAVTQMGEEPLLVMEYMDNGSLFDILHNETVDLDGDLILPILQDIARGARFLHAATPKVIHGDLKAANVLVDNRFRAKVADFGLSGKSRVGVSGSLFWMGPELLSGRSSNTSESDVYAFGILLYELFSRKEPYDGEDPHEVLKLIIDESINKRPPIPKGCPSKIASIMTECVEGQPEKRPTFHEIDERIKRLDSENVEPSSHYHGHGFKKAARNQDLLHQIFPKHVAEALRDGRKVEPDRSELATVFFSDIVGFTKLSGLMSPDQVSDMLDRLYLRFDELTLKHDIFKLETIGDAYVCVANLVKPQESDHVKRIAEFAIDAKKVASETPVKLDDPSMGNLSIRVGFHSGPLIARVVGSRNPRYCIFGDTVNTASRMESTSVADKIHCSESAANLLQKQCPMLRLRKRGSTQIKGKGRMSTFFVECEKQVTTEASETTEGESEVTFAPDNFGLEQV